ncbi:MAG: Chemotaxis protein CheV [Syntrophorhabdaceae bacterium PtaU1.Bin034]|nr:MAG: Chemotaxis protein CheV [Syntrophorhabdaceae bacterium PtaU1.Bin034]
MGTAVSNILLEAGTNEVEILEVYIDEEDYRGHYGVNVAKILEIIPMPTKITQPPHLKASFAVGVFNHRDKLVPLLDLAKWLGRAKAGNAASKVLITEFNNTVTAFLVSGVTRIHRVTWGDIRPLDGYTEGLSDTITSVIELEGRIVFLLDLEKAIGDLDPNLAISGSSLLAPDVGARDYKPIKVLHADDSTVIRSTVKRRLEENRIFSVNSVMNGDEAWEHLLDIKNKSHATGEPLENSVEVILTDIEMPGMDGYHLCKRIKDDQELRSIPVVLFSSLINEKLLHKGEAVGADGQFTKPDLELMHFIKATVDKRRQSAT